jgi:hypothetical protein
MADYSIFADDTSAAPILSSLRQGKWRRARDLAKELCKQDKARYLPLLIAANEGLARELLSRGQTSEAAQVVAYLKTIAPPEVVAALQQVQVIAPSSIPVSDGALHWLQAQRLAERVERSAALLADCWGDVDALVTGNFHPPTAEAGSLEARVGAELTSVLQAVAATATGDWENAQTALRALPRLSIFQHWRMLLRGVRLTHLGERDQAQQCFDTLPPNSTPARAATLWREVLGLPLPTSIAAPSEKRAEILTLMAGGSETWGRAISRADGKWRRHDFLGAYETIREPLGKDFPTDVPGLAQVITDAVLPVPANLRTDSEWLDYAESLWSKTAAGLLSLSETILLRKFAVRTQVVQFNIKSLWEDWNKLVVLIRSNSPSDATRDSLLWLAAGQSMQRQLGQPRQFLMRRIDPKDLKLTETAFENATTADPLHAEAQLAFLEFYRQHGTKAQLGKQAEVLIKSLPNHKEGLREAGRLAIQRKAYAKGLEFLQRVRQLDPLDREAAEQIISAILNQASDALKKKPSTIPKLWAQLELELPSASLSNASFAVPCHRWTIRMAQSLIEPDPVLAEKFRLEAQSLAPSLFEAMVYGQFLSHEYRVAPAVSVQRDWATVQASADWTLIRRTLIMLEHWRAKLTPREFHSLFMAHLVPAMKHAGGPPVTQDLEGFRELLAWLWTLDAADDYVQSIYVSNVTTTLKQGLRNQLAESPDPRLQCAWQLLFYMSDEFVETSDVEEILLALTKQNHTAWLPLANLLLEYLIADDDYDKDDPDMWGDDDEDDDDETDFDENAEMSQEELELAEEMSAAGRDPEFSDFIALEQKVQRSTLPPQVKKPLLDALKQLIMAQNLRNKPITAKFKKQAKAPPIPNPDQGELPF